VNDVLSWSEAARRLKESPHAIRGAVISQGWPLIKFGTAYVLTEDQFDVLKRQWQQHSARAAISA